MYSIWVKTTQVAKKYLARIVRDDFGGIQLVFTTDIHEAARYTTLARVNRVANVMRTEIDFLSVNVFQHTIAG